MKVRDYKDIVKPKEGTVITKLEIAAALVSLGFEVLESTKIRGDLEKCKTITSWKFANTSPDYPHDVNFVLSKWNDIRWLTDNNDALAAIVAGFHNREKLLDSVKQGQTLVSVKQGDRYVLVNQNASEETKEAAKRHLKGF